MRRNPFLTRLKQAAFALLCAAGALSGGLLLLDRGGYGELLWPGEPESAAEVPVWSAGEPEEEPDRGELRLVELKLPSGDLTYVSAIPLAMDAGVSDGDPARNEALTEENRTPGTWPVAVVSCFRDDALGGDPTLALLRPFGSPFVDADGGRWLDPASPRVLPYLAEVCREAAGLGFREVVLTHCWYPAGYGAEQDPETAAALAAFCRGLWEELAGLPLEVSVELARSGQAQGQDAGALAVFDRVWVRGTEGLAPADFSEVEIPGE